MGFDWNIVVALVAAVAALIAALVAVVAVCIESRWVRFTLGTNIILSLDEKFQGEEYRKIRRDAATAFLNENLGDERWEKGEPILNFFETIAILCDQKVLNEEIVWEVFFYWMHRYYQCMRKYLENIRKNDPTMWENLVNLHKRLVEIEKHKRRCSDVSVPERVMNDFLVTESKL